MIDRWLSIPASESTQTDTGAVSHRNLERTRSTTSEALSLARELMTLIPALKEPEAGPNGYRLTLQGARHVRFKDHRLVVITQQYVTTYESSREDERRLSDVLGMGAIQIMCVQNAGNTIMFIDSHTISRAEARALLELELAQ